MKPVTAAVIFASMQEEAQGQSQLVEEAISDYHREIDPEPLP